MASPLFRLAPQPFQPVLTALTALTASTALRRTRWRDLWSLLAWLPLLIAAPRVAAQPAVLPATPPPVPALTAAPLACPPPIAPAPLAVPAGTRAEPDRGLLWRLTRDGRSSYLYATLHVGKPAWKRFGPQVSAALRATNVLALEIDPGDPALLQALAAVDTPPPLPDALQARLRQAFERACVSPGALAALHPLLQATTLAVLDARWLGMDPAYAMELLLAAHARAAGRRVVALETAAQQQAALVPAVADEALSALDQGLRQLEDQSGRRVLAVLSKAWEQGDLDTLQHDERWCECAGTGTSTSASNEADRAFMRRLNDARNPLLADGIEAQHRQGRRVFAAVGALHMTGPSALPLLLAQRGFKVERVPFAR